MVAFDHILAALVTGLLIGAIFGLLDVPIPAPPELAGVMGIFGIYLGFTIVDHMGLSIDLLGFG